MSAEVADLLDRQRPEVTYKPEWTFRWQDAEGWEGGPGAWLKATFRRVNAYQPDAPPDLCDYGFFVPADADLGPWLLNRLHAIEYHEVCEWLKFDGQQVADPHAITLEDFPTGRIQSAAAEGTGDPSDGTP